MSQDPSRQPRSGKRRDSLSVELPTLQRLKITGFGYRSRARLVIRKELSFREMLANLTCRVDHGTEPAEGEAEAAPLDLFQESVYDTILDLGEAGATLADLRRSHPDVPKLVVALVELAQRDMIRVSYVEDGNVLSSAAAIVAAVRQGSDNDRLVLRYVATG